MSKPASLKQTEYLRSLYSALERNEAQLSDHDVAIVTAHADTVARVLAHDADPTAPEASSYNVSQAIDAFRTISRKFQAASPKQVAFIRSLAQAAGKTDEEISNLTSNLSAQDASPLIDQLKALPKAAKAPKADVPTGVHFTDGTWFKVKVSRTTGNPYAMRWSDGWVFERGLISSANLSELTKVTAEQAAAFGHLTGNCVFCDRELTDERSISVGYGPVCAKNHGLPWGETSSAPLFQAVAEGEAVVNDDNTVTLSFDSINFS